MVQSDKSVEPRLNMTGKARISFLKTMAIGDAYGMRLEFIDHDCTIGPTDLCYAPHPTYKEYKPAHYTDDTQMTAANAIVLLNNPGYTFLHDEDFIDQWLTTFKSDPREGYSRYMNKVMTESISAADFISRIDGRGTTSGGAMRAGIFGLLPNVTMVMDLTLAQASITHNTLGGVNAAFAVALATHFLHHGGSRSEMTAFVGRYFQGPWNSPANGYSDDPSNGIKIVSQAFDALLHAASMSDVLLRAINHTPVADTDTICALAMMMASRCHDLPDDLPQNLIDDLENGPYGRDYLDALDQKIAARFPSLNLYSKPAPAQGLHPAL